MARATDDELLLGEWACLGILCTGPAHGFAVAARLRPDGDVGRVWSLSRALTYRSLDQLVARGLAAEAGEERGIAGGTRTILVPTDTGRARLRSWLRTPVPHLRDLRSELLVKLVLAGLCGVDTGPLLLAQREVTAALAAKHDAQLAGSGPTDPVELWRAEASHAALRVLDRLIAEHSPSDTP